MEFLAINFLCYVEKNNFDARDGKVNASLNNKSFLMKEFLIAPSIADY